MSEKCNNFCTIIGKEYLMKGIALYDSLKKNSSDFHLWICCLDKTAYSTLNEMKLENATFIPLEEVEDSRLLLVKYTRNTSEYCWTLKSSWILYLLSNHPEIESVVYLDGDMFFFSDPQPVFDELQECSVLMCRQRDLEEVERVFGKYQAGFIGFKNNHISMHCLKWWRDRCLEWCSSEQGLHDRWGDQKYLDQWPTLLPEIEATENLGIDAAIWNAKDNVSVRDSEVYIKDFKLIAYHFCCVICFDEAEFDLWQWPNWAVDNELLTYIYLPYIKALREAMRKLAAVNGLFSGVFNTTSDKSTSANYFKYYLN